MCERTEMEAERSPSRSLSSLFGCLQTLCNHHDVALSLTPEALDALVTGREGLAAAEAALAEAGFVANRIALAADSLQPGRSFPLLAERRLGGFVLVVGVRGSNGQELIGVFDPEDGKARARPWTRDLAAKALAGEALEVTVAHAARRSRRNLQASVAAPPPPDKRARRRKDAMADIYADAFENILVHGGTVRIDLATYSPRDKTDGDEPALELTGRLVMPIEGFVRAFGGIGEVIRQMVEAGVIEPVENPAGGRAGGHA